MPRAQSNGNRHSRNSFSGGVFSVMRDEWVVMRILLPYIGMVFGMLIVMLGALFTRIFISFDATILNRHDSDHQRYVDTWTVTGIVAFSALLLTWLAYMFWGQRKAVIIKEHAAISVAVSHMWWIGALWENYGKWFFTRMSLFGWLFGSAILGLSWCFRYWAVSKADDDTIGNAGFDTIGLGDGTHMGRSVIDGDMVRTTMFLRDGKTTDDAKKSRAKIAALAGKPLAQVHVRDHKSGDFDKAEVIVLKRDPFKDVRSLSAQFESETGLNIVDALTYATYEDSTRPELHLAGHKGGSSQHFLVMGMSGTGKSKAWQNIYGRVLRRKEVNVIYIDPAKGIQTAGPLLKGIDLFVDDVARGQSLLERVQRAIRDRTDYLAGRGLSHWEPGCGINFLIVHIEEAARFSKTKNLVELVEAARSAGIMIVISLQRAEGSRLNTNTRYNLGGSMCFGTYGLRDAEFALSEYTRQSGAIPHHWQDRYPGRHYLEASGIDPRQFSMSLQVDWLDIGELREAVSDGVQYHTPMDAVTASALGDIFAQYRSDVDNENTQWQQVEKTGIWTPKNTDTVELPAVPDDPTPEKATLSVADAERTLWDWLTIQRDNGVDEMQFKDIVAGASPLVLRQAAWINVRLKKWVASGHLPPMAREGVYVMPHKRA